MGDPYPKAHTPGRADGFVLGTSGDNNMDNITFRNCSAHGTLRGIIMKFRPTQDGTIKNIHFEDFTITNPTAYALGINIDSPHLNSSLPVPDQVGVVDLSEITFKNINGVAAVPGHFSCKSHKCSGIHMDHVHFQGTSHPCIFNNVFGDGEDVSPSSCIPPKDN